jgi:arginyl-tRNA--protein-N-Asp/Glu arginylyltransferase
LQLINAINWSKENNKEYIYLGSVTDSKSKYKLQFEGLEWFNTDTQLWETDLEKLKVLIP